MQLSDILATITAVNFYTTDTDPEEPWDNYRADGIMKNPFAIANGSWGAIIQAAAIAGGAVTAAKLAGGTAASGNLTQPVATQSGTVTGITWVRASTDDIVVERAGTYRIGFTIASSASSVTAYGRIYVNGVATGATHSTTAVASGSSSYIYFYDDLALAAGDILSVYMTSSTGAAVYLNAFPSIGSDNNFTPISRAWA